MVQVRNLERIWKFERIINSVPFMDLKSYLHLTLKLEMLKVKVKDMVEIDYRTHQGVYACQVWKSYRHCFP